MPRLRHSFDIRHDHQRSHRSPGQSPVRGYVCFQIVGQPGHPILKFEERASNAPEALRSFFYPGDNYGLLFVYLHDQAIAIAKRTNQNVLTSDSGDMKRSHISGVNGNGESVDMNTMIQSAPK